MEICLPRHSEYSQDAQIQSVTIATILPWLKKTVAIADDIVQAIWIKRVANVTISKRSINIRK